MSGSLIGALLAGVSLAFAGGALWYGLRGIGEVYDLATADREYRA